MVLKELSRDVEFFDWYLDKTGAKSENVSGISFSTLPFFDALPDFGKTPSDIEQLNFDDIVTYLKDPSNTPAHMGPSWNDDAEKYLLSFLKEFLQVKGYLDDVPGLLSLDAYKAKVLDFEYSFYDDEPAVFSFPDK